MNTGTFAFTSDGTVQVDGSNVATLNHAPTGTGLVHKTGAGVMKVASDLSASAALAGIHVDAGTLYVASGKAPNAPIAVASAAVMELGAGLAAGSVGGAVTVASGAEMLVDASATVPHQNTSTTYTFNATTGYFMSGSTALPWPSDFTGYLGLVTITGRYAGTYHTWTTTTSSPNVEQYGSITDYQLGPDTGSGSINVYAPIFGEGSGTYTTTTTADIFASHLEFVSGSKLALGAGSTWARDIHVGTAT